MNIITTKNGQVEGTILESNIACFKGIPYAEPPVKELRWRRPQPVKNWEGIREAKQFGPICPQKNDNEFYAKEFGDAQSEKLDEDCLYLNIWTPATTAQDNLPVLVFIHGGGYDHGFGHRKQFDGENFAKKGCILVTLSYRVGVFGFISHQLLDLETEQSGNYGLYDQLAALKWVQENISSFGGNPSNVTVFGQSAGAMSCQILYESPMARGLFNKVIMQSGGGYITKIPFVKSIGCRTRQDVQKSSDKILIGALKLKTLEEARNVPALQLLDAYAATTKPMMLCPFPDGEIFNVSHSDWEKRITAELHQQPKDQSALDEIEYYRKMPVIIGCLEKEFGFPTNTYFWRCSLNLCDFLANNVFDNTESDDQNKGPYFYFGKYSMPGEDNPGSFHSSDHWLVFGSYHKSWRPMDEKVQKLSDLFSSYWANFAKTGNPNQDGLPLWEPYTKTGKKHLSIYDHEQKMEA